MSVTPTNNGSVGTGGGGLHQEIHAAIDQVEHLKVSELKAVCRSIELPITGRKAVLQDRIRAYLKNSCSIGHIDPWRPKTIRVLIDKAKLGELLPKYEILWQTLRSGAYNHPVAIGAEPVGVLNQQDGSVSGQDQYVVGDPSAYTSYRTVSPEELSITGGSRTAAPKNRYMHFKESPFYRIKKLIQETAQKLNVTNVRGTCVAKWRFTKADWTLLESDEKYKVYLFCGMVDPQTGFQSNQPIQFPHPNEIRVNSVQVKDNVRGLKNKPGTAKPADLTPYLRPPTQQNSLEVIYAFTKSEYFIYGYIVEQVTPEELLQEVLRHPKILKAATLHYIEKTLNDEEDDDLVTTSTVMTLQCPVSYTRMKYPAKSIMCKHLQCFDALWYIYSQMQIPTWQCPVCQIDIDLKHLAVCQFVDEILKNSDEDTEQVELSSDGSWKPVVEEPPKPAERPLPTTHSTSVKQENTDDDDNRALADHSRGTSPSNEPVVISLDSESEEDEQMDPPPQQESDPAPPRAQEPTRQESLRTSAATSYVDDNTSQHTLDPRANQTITPTAPRQNSLGADNSLDYVERRQGVPNILGKTPLNNGEDTSNQDTPLAEEGPSSPTPNSSTRGMFTPAATNSPAGNDQWSNDERPVFRSHSGTLDPRASGIYESSENNHSGSNSMLGMTGQISGPPGDDSGGPSPSTNNSSNNLLGISGNLSSFRPEESQSYEPQKQQQQQQHQQQYQQAPPLPPLPDPKVRQPSRPPIPGRTRKPVVSPFLPPKPYLNMLPRKRHISNSPNGGPRPSNEPPMGSQQLGVSMNDPNTVGNVDTSGAHRGGATRISGRDDVIDLTSD
ncbi:hypothetical protein ZYGR_0N05140 [Zygosaccharomyces rouxii]|uniref:E3 SUMO-protein transferase SIZ2 n=2 Tax=Zygosaccharomyces rouxii TaxID=4956 RepID=C5DW57_ZYGRC|nr:uncharacterized protein ZYRO0D12078g [Zygosaccharomyces rouxii]KAH9200936.1 PINIT domain-containing protein [Zygosaccharomyces rouxii]GAV49109.1 hypothetical protein ZYGR_0N05140 [Zygosaccharomyces rouxii]CAR28026.1 ZYRO0D12078p [Zygosaccharomyces rouxii]